MKRIKTLTVGGETYRITDPEAARIDDTVLQEAAVWSGKHTVDMLAPAFLESGSIVACQPVAGYPLTVTAQEGATVTRCGKNLWDLKPSDSTPVSSVTYTGNEAGDVYTRIGYRITLPAGTYTFHAELIGEAGGYMYGVVNGADGTFKGKVNLVVSEKLHTVTVTLDEGDVVYLYNAVGNSTNETKALFAERYNVQVEAGSVSTDYEPYRAEAFTPEETIPALPGVNTLWADTGSITVAGRLDPTAVMAEQNARLAALEAALINE